MREDPNRPHRLFDHPSKADIVRLEQKSRSLTGEIGWMTPEKARARVEHWKTLACAQGGPESPNRDKIVISLFDLTGSWSRPWEEAGYQVYRFDIQADAQMGDVNNFSVEFFNDWFGSFDGLDIYAILAACPCTDFAVSGAKHFAAKDRDGRTAASIRLVEQTKAVIDYFQPSIWAVENPVGRIEELGSLPRWRLSFDPYHFGDTYTKKTLIWGRFNADLPIAPVEPVEGSKMHKKFGGKSLKTKNARSETPEGFSYGFFLANNALHHPELQMTTKYDRLDPSLLAEVLALGAAIEDVSYAIDDAYYIELDDEGAHDILRGMIAERSSLRAA
ncbi:MAG: DNA cytosine methyltransferase [Stutzerimonas stutzeri]|nr:MAG: DNA cytosine methyltransferase [Stutzerimonas stutzeri]